MSDFTAVLDACVLYPAPLRDFLLQLALTDLFRARWSDDIHDEWIRNLLAKRPDLTLTQLSRTRQLMDQAVPESLVTGYERLVDELQLPDPNDRHVLAAAIRCKANVIVTFNLDDFPPTALEPYAIEVHHPDNFVQHLLNLDPEAIYTAARRQRQALKRPPKTALEFLDTLAAQGLANTAALLGDQIVKL